MTFAARPKCKIPNALKVGEACNQHLIDARENRRFMGTKTVYEMQDIFNLAPYHHIKEENKHLQNCAKCWGLFTEIYHHCIFYKSWDVLQSICSERLTVLNIKHLILVVDRIHDFGIWPNPNPNFGRIFHKKEGIWHVKPI